MTPTLADLHACRMAMLAYSPATELVVVASREYVDALHKECGFGDPQIEGALLFGMPIYVRADVRPGDAYIMDRRYLS